MDKKELIKKYNKLKEKINYHNNLYYNLENPEISDYEYDKLFKLIISFEEKFPDLKTNDSPSYRIGSIPLSNFEKYNRKNPMLSLQNGFEEDDILNFHEKIKEKLDKKDIFYTIEEKYDGVSIEIEYKNGELKRATTRGDGITGEVVTNNVKTIKNIPLSIKTKEKIIVRGEIILSKKEFERINKEREQNKEKLFANPRNAASGSLRQLDSKITAQRKLKMFAYYLKGIECQSQAESLNILKNLGFEISNNILYNTTFENIKYYYKGLVDIRKDLEYEIDGIVIKVDYFEEQEKLGYRSNNPKWAIAWKFPAEEKTTLLKSITLQVGKSGIITPVAELEPVNINGVIVKRATLHNFKEIENKDIRINDTVILKRAGDVIPKIIKPVESLRKDKPVFKINRPEICPICKSQLVNEDIFIRCINVNCKAQLKEKLKYFISKSCFNIDGFGKKTIDQMVDNNIITSFIDIFSLNKEELLKLDRMGEKKVNKLFKNIEKSKNIKLSKFLNSLSIPNIGIGTCELLEKRIYSIEELFEKDQEFFESINTFGAIMTESIINYLKNNKEEIKKLLNIVNIMKKENIEEKDSWMNNKSFVITGKLSKPRSELQKLIEENGGIFKSSISKNIDYLVCGEKVGGKLEKAKKLNIEILDEKTFENKS